MTSRPPPQCLFCKHWESPLDRTDANAAEEEPTQVCSAFLLAQGGIPAEIWWNEFDHRQAWPGDGGIRWLGLDGVQFPDWAMAETA